MCGMGEESIENSLLECDRARKVWSNIIPTWCFVDFERFENKCWVDVFMKLQKEDFVLTCVGAWVILGDRNKSIHHEHIPFVVFRCVIG